MEKNDLSLTGEITKITELQTGTSKAGNEWQKLGFVVTTQSEYPKDAYFTVFGEEKVANFMKFNKVGQMVEVSFNIQSREYNERWYTDLGAWKVVSEKATKESTTPDTNGEYHKANDDLPF